MHSSELQNKNWKILIHENWICTVKVCTIRFQKIFFFFKWDILEKEMWPWYHMLESLQWNHLQTLRQYNPVDKFWAAWAWKYVIYRPRKERHYAVFPFKTCTFKYVKINQVNGNTSKKKKKRSGDGPVSHAVQLHSTRGVIHFLLNV